MALAGLRRGLAFGLCSALAIELVLDHVLLCARPSVCAESEALGA